MRSGASSRQAERAKLQERLAMLFQLMFWSLVLILGFLGFMYSTYEELPHSRLHFVFAGSAVGLAAMAFIWRALLVSGRELSIAALYRIDLIYCLGIGASFGASAYLQYELHPAGYLSVVYTTFAVYARALIVPSSAARTAVASSATFLPMMVAAAALAASTEQELPGPAFFTGFLVLSVVPVMLSAFGSWTLYDLRHRLDKAMQLGKYRLGRQIGKGGMGEVYLAEHVLLRGRRIAIKVVQRDQVGAASLERFEREVQATSKLTHPNTVAVFDYARNPDGLFYYAMEYLDGIDLESLVKKHGPQPAPRVAHVLAQVCGALAEAHAHGITHRDIKPANIILCERGLVPDVAKVVDFGLAKEITHDTGTSAETILGTPAYLSPEALSEPAKVGPASDLYALGAVGYYLVTGRRVFEAKTTLDMCVQHLTKEPTPPSQVVAHAIDPALEAILMRCLAKAPADRYANAEAMAEALRAVPSSGDWTEADAREFWRTRRAIERELEAASGAETLTVSVDLGERAFAAGPVKPR